jgi:hypothetical protein
MRHRGSRPEGALAGAPYLASYRGSFNELFWRRWKGVNEVHRFKKLVDENDEIVGVVIDALPSDIVRERILARSALIPSKSSIGANGISWEQSALSKWSAIRQDCVELMDCLTKFDERMTELIYWV